MCFLFFLLLFFGIEVNCWLVAVDSLSLFIWGSQSFNHPHNSYIALHYIIPLINRHVYVGQFSNIDHIRLELVRCVFFLYNNTTHFQIVRYSSAEMFYRNKYKYAWQCNHNEIASEQFTATLMVFSQLFLPTWHQYSLDHYLICMRDFLWVSGSIFSRHLTLRISVKIC